MTTRDDVLAEGRLTEEGRRRLWADCIALARMLADDLNRLAGSPPEVEDFGSNDACGLSYKAEMVRDTLELPATAEVKKLAKKRFAGVASLYNDSGEDRASVRFANGNDENISFARDFDG